MVYTPRFFFSSECSLFHISNVFGSCIIHILYTGCAKIKKKNSGAKMSMVNRHYFAKAPKEYYIRRFVFHCDKSGINTFLKYAAHKPPTGHIFHKYRVPKKSARFNFGIKRIIYSKIADIFISLV